MWIVGDVEDPAFAPAIAWLRKAARPLVRLEQMPALADAIRGDTSCAAILFFQSRPARISQNLVEQWHRLAPLASLAALVGPWCEGEPRSGRPWPGVPRIYWHQWQARLPPALGLSDNRSSPLAPRTLSETDLLLRSLAPGAVLRASRAGLAAIVTHRRETYASLADALWIAGLRSVWQQPDLPLQHRGADLTFFDGWESCQASAAGPGDATSRPPAILLADWPRPADLQRAQSHGIAQVLARPLLVTDLLTTIDLVLGAALPTPASAAAA